MTLNLSGDLLPIIVATLVNFFFGFIWYGPLFGKEWVKLVGLSKKQMDEAKKQDMKKPMLIMILTTIITVYVVNVLLASLQVMSLAEGLFLGVLVWAGFYFTKDVGQLLWERKSIRLLYMNTTYNLIMVLITVLILMLL